MRDRVVALHKLTIVVLMDTYGYFSNGVVLINHSDSASYHHTTSPFPSENAIRMFCSLPLTSAFIAAPAATSTSSLPGKA